MPKRAIYAGFTLEEIMEFFDWGLIFPNAYLPLLLTANDYKSRFQVDKTSFTISLSEQLSNKHNYYLEFDGKEIEKFLEDDGCSIYPIPAHFVTRIVCDSTKSQKELERIWPLTDNDEIESVLMPFEKVEEDIVEIDLPKEKIDQVLSFIIHFDKCLGAICFTKDLDPFIKTHFKEAEEFSYLNYSRDFLSLVSNWMPVRQRGILKDLLPSYSEKYIALIEKMVEKNGDDAYLKALSETNQPINEIVKDIAAQFPGLEKIPKVLREIELGISSLETALEDERLKEPYALFLILLKLFYRKGRLETDARSFRKNLFEKDYIDNPEYIGILGSLYGYYTGYHHFQRFESIKELGILDINNDKEVLNIFRLRLSPLDSFEKEVMNLIYNKVSANYTGFPQLKLSFKKQKGKRPPILRDEYTFMPVPQLGQSCYQLHIKKKQ